MAIEKIEFPLGSDPKLIKLLKAQLLACGMNNRNFFHKDDNIQVTYLDIANTYLDIEVETEFIPGGTQEFHTLYYDETPIAFTVIKKAEERSTLMSVYPDHFVDLPPSLIVYKVTVEEQKISKSPEDLAKEQFLKGHDELFRKQSSRFFGSLRKTKINTDLNLEAIVKHAIEEDNRSRRVMVKLGWLSKKGEILYSAPQCVKQIYEQQTNSQIRHVDKFIPK